MKLKKYLAARGMTATHFAAWMTRTTGIKIRRERVYTWLSGTIPRPEIMTLIYDLTSGEVDDWFPCDRENRDV